MKKNREEVKNGSVKKLQTEPQKKHYKHETLSGIIAGVDKTGREHPQ